MIKKNIFILFSFFLSFQIFAENRPLVLETGKEYYELGLHLDILEDSSRKLTIEDVQSPKWSKKFKRSKEKVPNFGFSDSVFWGRFKIKNNSTDENKWVVSQNYYLQDEVIFFKKDKGKWESKKTGDTLPFSTREIGTRSFSFQLNPENESIYYFKIKGVTHQLNLSLSSMKYLIRNETKNNFVLGLFFGLVVTMIIYNLFIFFSTKNFTSLYYVLYVFFSGLWMAGYQGYSQKMLFPETPWMSNNGNAFVHGNAVMFACIFTISFLKLKDNAPKLYRIISFFCITSFLITPCSLIFSYSTNVRLYVLNMMIAIPFIFYAGVYQVRNKFRPAKYFVYAWSFLLLGNFITGLLASGIIPSTLIFRLANVLGFAIELLLLSMGLADRFNLIQEEALKKEEEAKLIQKNYANLLKNEVNLKTKNIKNLVENLGQGFMVFDDKGMIQEGATEITKSLFSTEPEGKNLAQILNLKKEKFEGFNKWLDNVWKGMVSFKDLRPLAPDFFEDNKGRYISLDYKPIYVEGFKNKIDKIICVATDKTQEIALEKQLERDKQNATFINICLKSPVEFIDLLQDSYDLLDVYPTIKEMDEQELFRKFHTLKARYGQFGAKILTEIINEVETEISKGNIDNVDLKVKKFNENLQLFIQKNKLIIEAANKFMVDNGHAIQVSDVIKKIDNSDTLNDLKSDLYKNYLLTDIKEKFERYIPLVEEIAERQNKSVKMNISGEKVLLEYSKYSTFVNVSIHLFRNMVDHGIETEKERLEKSKNQEGKIKIDFKKEEKFFLINLSDDGRGINPEIIKKILLKKGLKVESDLENLNNEEMIDLIFLPGFSTKNVVTEISGRGVGMDAVREEVERLGGQISASSKIDEGTAFLIKLPILS